MSPRNSILNGHSILELELPPSVATRYPIDEPPTLRPVSPRPRPQQFPAHRRSGDSTITTAPMVSRYRRLCTLCSLACW